MHSRWHFLRTKLTTAARQLPYMLRALSLVWAATRRWTLVWLGLLILQGLLPIAIVYLVRALVDRLVATLAVPVDWLTFRPLLWLVLLLAGTLLLIELLRSGSIYVRTAQSELVRDHISRLIHAQSVAVDLAFYDSPDYYDHLHRARYQAVDRPLRLLENLGSVLQNGITLLAMAAVLIPFGVVLPLALLISCLPAFGVVLSHRLQLHHWHQRTTAAERRAWYYEWLLTDRTTAAEMRLFQLGEHFSILFQQVRRTLRTERLTLAHKQLTAEASAAISALVVTGITLLWMLWRTSQGILTLGDLTLFYQAFNQGQRLTRTLLDNVGELYTNSLFLGDLFEFLALTPRITGLDAAVGPTGPLQHAVQFENVTFRYPGSNKIALDHFHLTIPAGKITAIVGVNGAGKSTLIKLLCRLYEPDEGQILFDGIDLRDFSLSELRRQIAVLFQEPVHYNNTAKENITLGDLTRAVTQEEIEIAAEAAGADLPIERLPQEYDTLLGRWFVDGAELSVGEWQRVAMARALYRRASIIIMDEPTSAMDPWAEDAWLQRLRAVATERTLVLITHRFTTALQADVVHVMEGGRIVESGQHNELLAYGGRYATLWHKQQQVTGGQRQQPVVEPVRHSGSYRVEASNQGGG